MGSIHAGGSTRFWGCALATVSACLVAMGGAGPAGASTSWSACDISHSFFRSYHMTGVSCRAGFDIFTALNAGRDQTITHATRKRVRSHGRYYRCTLRVRGYSEGSRIVHGRCMTADKRHGARFVQRAWIPEDS